jgi:hypothetical protein
MLLEMHHRLKELNEKQDGFIEAPRLFFKKFAQSAVVPVMQITGFGYKRVRDICLTSS